MENTVKPEVRIKNSILHKTQISIVVVVAIIFALLFLNNTKLTNPKLPFTPQGAPNFSHFIYGGFGDEQLWKPMAVTTIGDKVFISDTNNYRIQSFTKEGDPINIFGSRGDEEGQFQFPYGLTGDSQGRLLVADMYNGRIAVFDTDGNFIEYFDEKGEVSKYIKSPSEITFYDGKLFVADVEQNRVYVFDENGNLALELGKEYNELRAPNGLTIDKKTGEIYVVDTRHGRVVAYDKEGTVLGQFDGTSEEKKDPILSNPRGISIDTRGIIYVVNSLSHMVYGFNEESEQLFQFGGMGDAEDQFVLPNGIHIDESNYIYITDTTNNRIAVYR